MAKYLMWRAWRKSSAAPLPCRCPPCAKPSSMRLPRTATDLFRTTLRWFSWNHGSAGPGNAEESVMPDDNQSKSSLQDLEPGDPTSIKALVRRFRVCWEVYPLQILAKEGIRKIG